MANCSNKTCLVLLTSHNCSPVRLRQGWGYCRQCASRKYRAWSKKNKRLDYNAKWRASLLIHIPKSSLSSSVLAVSARQQRKEDPQYFRNAVNRYAASHRKEKRNYDWKLERRHKHFTTRYLLKENVCKTDALWSLNFYKELLRDNECHYCGGSVLDSYGCKLDRMDSTLPHVSYNVVVCCTSCNVRKMHDLSYEEMMLLSPALKEIRLRRLGLKNEDLPKTYSGHRDG